MTDFEGENSKEVHPIDPLLPGVDVSWWKRLAEMESDQRWSQVLNASKEQGWSFEGVRKAWGCAFKDHDSEKHGPLPCWFPQGNPVAQRSNVVRFAKERGWEGFSEIHRWSREKPGEFWKEMIDHFRIPFNKSPEKILGTENGVERAEWLPGAELNISSACFSSDVMDQPAIVFQRIGEDLLTWTYAELLKNVQLVAAACQASGLAGKRVGIFMPMTPWCVAIYLGVIRAGGTIVSIADSFAAPEIAKRLEISEAEAIFTYDFMHRGGKQFPLVDRVHQAGDWQAIVLSSGKVIGGKAENLRENDLQFSDWVEKGRDASSEPVPVPVDNPINILFSSGTTGDPKAIPWDHSTPLKCAVDGYFHQDIQQGDVVAWPTNMGWMMGPWLVFATLLNRGTIALYGDLPAGKAFGKFVQDTGINVFGLVPSMVKNWLKSRRMEKFDWSKIKLFTSTGEASDSEDYFYLSYLGGFKPIIEYCGGTEIGGGYVSSTLDRPNCPGTFSGPAIGSDFLLLDMQQEPGNKGEVFLLSPSIGLSKTLLNRDHFKTYYEGAPKGPDGQVLRRHGDHFLALKGGYFAAGGRVDDTMNLGGIKISSVELEAVLNQADGVVETAAIAYEDGSGPSALCVFVVVDKDSSKEAELDLLPVFNQLLREKLNPLFRAAQVKMVDKLPRTASNKVMRRVLRDQL